MQHLHLILCVFALVLFVVATLSMAQPYWNRLVSAGLACIAAAMIW